MIYTCSCLTIYSSLVQGVTYGHSAQARSAYFSRVRTSPLPSTACCTTVKPSDHVFLPFKEKELVENLSQQATKHSFANTDESALGVHVDRLHWINKEHGSCCTNKIVSSLEFWHSIPQQTNIPGTGSKLGLQD